MKKINILQLLIGIACMGTISSCNKDEIDVYEKAPGIYFNGYSTTYNFLENPNNKVLGCDTVNIPFLITGESVNYERNIKIRLAVEDTITAPDGVYEILPGSVPADSYQGILPVKINYSPLLDDSVYVTKFRIVATDEFPIVDLNRGVFKLFITNKFEQPANWERLQSHFGNYSDSWYRFILEVTKLPSIPYWSYQGSKDKNNPDPERYPMTYNEMRAYRALVNEALTKYNNAHPGNPLKHEDGKYKGQVITLK